MSAEKRQEELNCLVMNHREMEFDSVWHKYIALCKRTSTPFKDFLQDVALYGDKKITVQVIKNAIRDAIHDIISNNEGLRSEKKEAREVKRQKLNKLPITKCKKCKNIISIMSKACDNNFVALPWGREVEGYCPIIPAVTNSDGACFDLCVDCGFIAGFKPNVVRAVMQELEQDYPADNNSEDNNSDNDD